MSTHTKKRKARLPFQEAFSQIIALDIDQQFTAHSSESGFGQAEMSSEQSKFMTHLATNGIELLDSSVKSILEMFDMSDVSFAHAVEMIASCCISIHQNMSVVMVISDCEIKVHYAAVDQD